MLLGFQSPFWSHFLSSTSYTKNIENQDTTTINMAGSKFATMLKRISQKIVAILAYAFLEWILIILLLCNSLFAYLITKFAAYFGLKPPCPWCSRVDHLLEPEKITDPFRSLVCDTHASEISKLTYCLSHKKLAEFENLCEECFSSQPKYRENQIKYSPKKHTCSCCEKTCSTMLQHPTDFALKGGSEIKEIDEKDGFREHRATEGDHNSGSECEHQVLSDVGSFYLRETADEDSNEDEETGKSKEDADYIDREVQKGNEEETKIRRVQDKEVAVTEVENNAGKKKIDISIKGDETFPIERVDHLLLAADKKALLAEESLHGSLVSRIECEHDTSCTIQWLKSDLEAERKARNDLYAELEAERNAAAIAANQTMAMITRLQEEKAAMQMEALQYQRVMEEQAEYDHEALRLLNELVLKREREKGELEKELDVYRERVSNYEAKENAMMMVQKCENGKFSSPCSVDDDSDVLSIDLNCHYNKEEDKDICLLDCSKEWGELQGSLQELEEERLAIMKQLKDLEEKLYESEKEEPIEPTAELCSQEVNLVPSCFSTDAISENQPKTMASVARKLLDFVDSDDGETEDEALTSKNEISTASNKLAIVKEMDHVYGRLQALEADTEFLRHCIGSVNKGNTGVNLLQEILQHLKELRSA